MLLCECQLECVLKHCVVCCVLLFWSIVLCVVWVWAWVCSRALPFRSLLNSPAAPSLPCCHWLLTPALLLLHHHSTTQHPPPSIPSKWIGKEIHIGVLSMLVSLLELTNTLNIYFLIHSMKLWYNLTHSFLWRRNKHNTIWLSFWSILWSEIVIESVCCELFTSLY